MPVVVVTFVLCVCLVTHIAHYARTPTMLTYLALRFHSTGVQRIAALIGAAVCVTIGAVLISVAAFVSLFRRDPRSTE